MEWLGLGVLIWIAVIVLIWALAGKLWRGTAERWQSLGPPVWTEFGSKAEARQAEYREWYDALSPEAKQVYHAELARASTEPTSKKLAAYTQAARDANAVDARVKALQPPREERSDPETEASASSERTPRVPPSP